MPRMRHVWHQTPLMPGMGLLITQAAAVAVAAAVAAEREASPQPSPMRAPPTPPTPARPSEPAAAGMHEPWCNIY